MIALILAAAGSGSRFGAAVPKQFLLLDGAPIYLRALKPFEPHVCEVIVVVSPEWRDRVESEVRNRCEGRQRLIVQTGGSQRQESVWKGLQTVSQDAELVLVHDAARPFPTEELIVRVIQEARRVGACIPALPVPETIKQVSGGRVVRTLDRSGLVLVQTPQGFRREVLVRAHEQALREGFAGTDDSVLVERLGVPVSVVEGDQGNIKVTWKGDLSQWKRR